MHKVVPFMTYLLDCSSASTLAIFHLFWSKYSKPCKNKLHRMRYIFIIRPNTETILGTPIPPHPLPPAPPHCYHDKDDDQQQQQRQQQH